MVPPEFLVGRSVHSREEAIDSVHQGGVDYLILGTVFASTSKPGVAPAGLELLRSTCPAVSIPVLAIGGITLERLPAIAEAGASGFAAMGLFARGDTSMASTVARARDAFRRGPSP